MIQDEVITGSGFYTREEAKIRIAELREEEYDLKHTLSKLQNTQETNENIMKEVSTDFLKEQLKEF
ncbi:hypothetical protein [Oceanobacillus jordanicus]|uniref:Uncharacterized protein n=1 Tax=Oceanobacillus jordanicus TaxID=2867266 RepID=A0AAW5AV15_9BACI|nr:hypothetical protein [Oceanobacillus jordanicus]MCG3417548.1 hypothetical protein [Oceanobacillus jordanicus]